MSTQEIVVRVIRYPDRPHFAMRYVDSVTGRQHARSTGTKVRREAKRLAAKWETELRTEHAGLNFGNDMNKKKGGSLAENSLSATISA